jgi:SAM-dependent methyltransferase
LAVALADAAEVTAGLRVVDVGCGPGGLAAELAARTGARNVAAIDPAAQFAEACTERNPGRFDAALSSLVIGFMAEPDQGVREMARVTRTGGTVAVCMWDMATGGMTMLRTFWEAARAVNPAAVGERRMAGTKEGDIAQRFERAGLDEVVAGALTASADYTGFDDFWEPLTLAVGPAGEYLQSLSDEHRAQVREGCRARLPEGAFSLDARAWYARGTVGEG